MYCYGIVIGTFLSRLTISSFVQCKNALWTNGCALSDCYCRVTRKSSAKKIKDDHNSVHKREWIIGSLKKILNPRLRFSIASMWLGLPILRLIYLRGAGMARFLFWSSSKRYRMGPLRASSWDFTLPASFIRRKKDCRKLLTSWHRDFKPATV